VPTSAFRLSALSREHLPRRTALRSGSTKASTDPSVKPIACRSQSKRCHLPLAVAETSLGGSSFRGPPPFARLFRKPLRSRMANRHGPPNPAGFMREGSRASAAKQEALCFGLAPCDAVRQGARCPAVSVDQRFLPRPPSRDGVRMLPCLRRRSPTLAPARRPLHDPGVSTREPAASHLRPGVDSPRIRT
jgi:hypothetical protein